MDLLQLQRRALKSSTEGHLSPTINTIETGKALPPRPQQPIGLPCCFVGFFLELLGGCPVVLGTPASALSQPVPIPTFMLLLRNHGAAMFSTLGTFLVLWGQFMSEQSSEKTVGSFLVVEAVLRTSRKFSAAIHSSLLKAKESKCLTICGQKAKSQS